MDVTVENKNSVTRTLNVVIPAEKVTKEMDAAYDELRKQAKIKGFRPGKAPRGVLENLYRKEVGADVAEKLVRGSLPDALREHAPRMIGTPRFDMKELVKGAEFRYSATVDLMPEIPELNLEALVLKRPKYQASEEEIASQLEMLRKNMGHLNPIEEDRPAREGDFVLVDYEGADEESQNAGIGKAEDFTVELGAGKILQDFDSQVAGMRKGETKLVPLTFPEDYFKQDLAGKSVTFKVTVKDIREQVLPALDDDLAQDLGDYQTIDELKAAILKNLQDGYDKRADSVTEEQVYRQLLDQVSFEVPDTLVESELDAILEESERALSYRNLSFEGIGMDRDKMRERYRETAEKQVRRYLILDAIAEQARLEVTEELLDKGFENMAAAIRQSKEVIREHYTKDREQLSIFKHTLLQKEALAHARRLARMEDVDPEALAAETEKAEGADSAEKPAEAE
jgi:trigger factor